MRNANTVLNELIQAKEQYAALRANKQATLQQVEDAKAGLKALSKELDAAITGDAKPCPNCGAKPMGMLKTPAYTKDGTDFPNVWEVGCVACPPFLQERPDGTALRINGEVVKVKRRSYSARGFSPDEAQQKWNNEQYVEDFFFDRIPGFVPEFVTEAA